MNRVAILISTYNGEKYLRPQLDSLIAQTGIEATIFARDDGSTDGTKDILAEYARNYDNFHYELAENVGVGNAFMKMIYSVSADFNYYSLADQDDVWEENKVSEAIAFLREHNAMLYSSNQENVDSNLIPLGMRYAPDEKMHLTPISIVSKNTVAGCTMVFTKEFRDIIADPGRRPTEDLLRNRIHDVWLALVASLYGGIVYDNRSFIKYRQHENNVVGSFKPSLSKRIKSRFKKVKDKKYRCGRSRIAAEACERFPEKTQDELMRACATASDRKSKKIILKHAKELRGYTGESGFIFRLKVKRNLF